MSEISYSFLDPSENVGIPQPMRHAGLYTSEQPYENTLWGKDYRGERVQPDAVEYAKHYNELARKHIPTSIRPGNNAVQPNAYSFIDSQHNTVCFT